jgi:hypothetical protein
MSTRFVQFGFVILIPGFLLGQQTPTRNLSLYEKSRSYEVRLLDPDRARKEADIREFLWEHWRERKRASLEMTAYSTEGERTVSVRFIEPDANGTWRLVVETERELVDRRGTGKRWTERLQLTCSDLERVVVPEDLLHPLRLIPQDAMRDPLSYRLHPNCGSERLPTVW